jgi:ankyrin repeat protein
VPSYPNDRVLNVFEIAVSNEPFSFSIAFIEGNPILFLKSPREPSILETLHLDNTACFNDFVQEYRDKGGNNALYYAIKTGNIDLFTILLETNIDLCFIKNKSGKTALDLLKDPQVDNKIKHCFSSNEYNLAHTILLHDDSLNNLKILENIYSDILVSKNDDNQSLLHIAAQINDKEMLTYLLNN